MSEEREVAKLAIAAAGAIGTGQNAQREWLLRVAEITPLIGAMLRPPGDDYRDLAKTPVVIARKVLEADIYRAEFVSFSDEEMEKSHRLLVRVKPEHGKPKYLDADGCEWLRTEPRWTEAGFVMQRLIRKLVPSTPILVYKYVEGFTSKGADEDEDKKSRVLVHFEVTGRPKNPPSGERPPSAPPGGGSVEAGSRNPSPAASQTPPEPSENPAIADRFKALKTAQQIAYMRACRGNDIAQPMDPGPDDIDRAIILLGKIERGEPVT